MVVTAQVAVDHATFQFDKSYTYLVPQPLLDLVRVGSMVLVPFGRGNGPRMGVVLSVEQQREEAKLKALYDCAPEECVLTDELLQLVYFLKEHTFCTYYDAVRAVIPYGAQYRPVGRQLKKQLRNTDIPVYRALPTTEKLTVKQQRVAELLLEKGPCSLAEIEKEAKAGKTVVDGLLKKGAAALEGRSRLADVYNDYTPSEAEILLSPAQQQVYEGLLALMKSGKSNTALLHGVTSSGKTLVFLKLIEQALSAGRQALILVPEISLTPQMVYRLKASFGSRVAVQHSALSATERLLQWQQIQRGEADVVVGTRSGVFAPLQNIGLIVLDEEQEDTYHSEQSPRYGAHEVARFRAAKHGALLLLSSATPSVDSYYRAKKGLYPLFELNMRYGESTLPEVEIADMRKELQEGNGGSISRLLAAELTANLAAGQQSILLLNRRGYQTVGMCTACGEVVKCTACSVPMVYHKKENKLMCHYCGRTISPVPERCPLCGEPLKYTGLGTQKVEEELAGLLPAARILRMDLDSTSSKNAHEEMLRAFREQKYDILIGTQMVAKGLDFPLVTLVGVIGIDQLLFAQSYRANERVFSLVTQVVGRGGRSDLPGRAVIQTLDPANRVLHLSAQQDYPAFFEEEIGFRKLHLYPPYCQLCVIGFQGTEEAKVVRAASCFLGCVRAAIPPEAGIPLRALGPAPYPVVMVKGRFRYKLTLKCRNNPKFRAALTAAMERFGTEKCASGIQLFIDFHQDSE